MSTPQDLSTVVEQVSASAQSLVFRYVEDATSAEMQEILSGIVADSITLAQLRIEHGDTHPVVAEYAADLQARITASANIPGLLASNRVAAFAATLRSVSAIVVSTGVGMLTGYINKAIPVVIASAVAAVDNATAKKGRMAKAPSEEEHAA